MSQDWVEDVLAFHRKFGCAVGIAGPECPDDTTASLRQNLMVEEMRELFEAMDGRAIAGIADACADLIYVVIGTAISFGIDLRPVWDAVQAANMAKEGGNKRPDGKVLKPAGWQAPDIAGILAIQEPLS